MKQFIILVLLLVSATAFSQKTSDSIFSQTPSESIVIMKVDTVQTERINNIEKSLTAYYTYNRRYHTLLFLSLGMSVASVIIANGQSNNTAAGVIQLAGGIVGLVGTVIYFDSYKFLNFKPKRKELRGMTYY